MSPFCRRDNRLSRCIACSLVLLRACGFCSSKHCKTVHALRAIRSREDVSAKVWYSLVSSFTKFVPAFPVGIRQMFVLLHRRQLIFVDRRQHHLCRNWTSEYC